MIEEIKLIGSIAGLLLGALTVWDRLVLGRPVAFITAKGSPHNFLNFLRVKNVSPIDILVLGVSTSPGYYKVANGDSIERISAAISDVPSVALLSPEEQRDFQFFKSPHRGPDAPGSKRVRFAIHWRKANRTWIPQVPVWMLTSEGDLEKMGHGLS